MTLKKNRCFVRKASGSKLVTASMHHIVLCTESMMDLNGIISWLSMKYIFGRTATVNVGFATEFREIWKCKSSTLRNLMVENVMSQFVLEFAKIFC